ncbi:unnamed protein product [Strongylus vulgaris]|uniref:Uncharacterized protein n=1 Tax=Strongylus vulgaris TaxID=40348 RepID=A0A3P7IV56_STRVU|nr:unnamed protein product [Strongylus vulgaris]
MTAPDWRSSWPLVTGPPKRTQGNDLLLRELGACEEESIRAGPDCITFPANDNQYQEQLYKKIVKQNSRLELLDAARRRTKAQHDTTATPKALRTIQKIKRRLLKFTMQHILGLRSPDMRSMFLLVGQRKTDDGWALRAL